MNEGNIDWVIAIVALLAGAVIGALIYHFSSSKRATSKRLKQRLAETELELNRLRDNVNKHFDDITALTDTIVQQSNELKARLSADAEQMSNDSALKRRLQGHQEHIEIDEGNESLHIPRDYAESSGTLDEHYGLKKKDGTESYDPQPPRY